jgi:hypothetical protein
MSVAGISAVSWSLLINEMVRAAPFQTAIDLLLKFLPFMVRTKPAPPAGAEFGEIEVIDGVDGQEQETTESQKSAKAPKRDVLFIVVIVTMHALCPAIGARLRRDCYHCRRAADVAD